MKITFISDTHTKHKALNSDLQGGPMIIHCGDISSRGKASEVNEFLDWFSELPYTHKIFIAGNHDFIFEKPNGIVIPENVHYLQDSFVIIEGIKIYGSPWQPWFYNWAFNLPLDGILLKEKWNMIPEDTDILVTHGPPFGIGDEVRRGSKSVGCKELLERVNKIKPKIHAFGHIHEAFGEFYKDGITFINASSLDEDYKYTHWPRIIDYEI